MLEEIVMFYIITIDDDRKFHANHMPKLRSQVSRNRVYKPIFNLLEEGKKYELHAIRVLRENDIINPPTIKRRTKETLDWIIRSISHPGAPQAADLVKAILDFFSQDTYEALEEEKDMLKNFHQALVDYEAQIKGSDGYETARSEVARYLVTIDTWRRALSNNLFSNSWVDTYLERAISAIKTNVVGAVTVAFVDYNMPYSGVDLARDFKDVPGLGVILFTGYHEKVIRQHGDLTTLEMEGGKVDRIPGRTYQGVDVLLEKDCDPKKLFCAMSMVIKWNYVQT